MKTFIGEKPGFYGLLAVVVSLYSIGGTFLCFSFIRYFFHQENWLANGTVVGAVLLALLGFTAFCYVNYLILDGKKSNAKPISLKTIYRQA